MRKLGIRGKKYQQLLAESKKATHIPRNIKKRYERFIKSVENQRSNISIDEYNYRINDKCEYCGDFFCGRSQLNAVEVDNGVCITVCKYCKAFKNSNDLSHDETNILIKKLVDIRSSSSSF